MAKQNLLSIIIEIISGTPIWVWFVFGYILFVGIKAMRPGLVYIPKLFIISAVFPALKYKTFLLGGVFIWMSYFICLFLSSFLSFKFSSKQKVKIVKESMSVKLPGTYLTLVVLVLFFILEYFFGYINVAQHDLYKKLQVFEVVICGIFSGYFFGKAVNYLNCYLRLKKG
jgi:hypothetical protein